MAANSNSDQDMGKLRERFDKLNTKKITAEANLKNSSENLEELKKEAREKYGTDDLAALRAMLETMISENERKRAEYQEHLNAIETQLADVEAKNVEARRKDQP
jgi:chromosome segregation ATPase